jgi:uncharacterized protein
MNNTIKIVALGFSLLLATVSICYSQDYVKGSIAYRNGDFATALREWRPLADQGNADAQYFLGLMYDIGKGVTQDYKEAVRLYGLAAAQGDALAQFNLGNMYRNGDGVTQDYKEAVRLYGLAADQGFADAQYNLGVMYNYGMGVIQDNVYAHMWFNIAASSGIEEAVKGRDIVADKMTAADISKAQDLARECVKKEYKGC